MKTKAKKPLTENDIDRLVGARLTALRKLRNMSQQALGDTAGLSFQQVQKYENGKNRISASRMVTFAKALGVSVSEFFADIDAPKQEGLTLDVMQDVEIVRLVRDFSSIGSDKQRKAVIGVVAAMAGVA